MVKTTLPFTTTEPALRCVMLQFAVPVCLSVCLVCPSVTASRSHPSLALTLLSVCLSVCLSGCPVIALLVGALSARELLSNVGCFVGWKRESWLAVDHWIASHYYMPATTTSFPKKKGEKQTHLKSRRDADTFSFRFINVTIIIYSFTSLTVKKITAEQQWNNERQKADIFFRAFI